MVFGNDVDSRITHLSITIQEMNQPQMRMVIKTSLQHKHIQTWTMNVPPKKSVCTVGRCAGFISLAWPSLESLLGVGYRFRESPSIFQCI